MLKCLCFLSFLYWVNDLTVGWWQEHDCYFTCWVFVFWFGGFFWVHKNKVLQFVNAHCLGNRAVGSLNCWVRNVSKSWRLFLKSLKPNPLMCLCSVPLKCFLVTRDLKDSIYTCSSGSVLSGLTQKYFFSSSWISKRKQVVFRASNPLYRPSCRSFIKFVALISTE